jgi:hypothetical protein
MDLSIIIVNWNSREYLKQCIASILAETHGIEYEIVVIDNASFDGSGEMLRECYPQVRFIQSDANLGFAKANNAAFHQSRGRHVLFLNPDTILLGPAINTMMDYLRQLSNVGAVGCKLLNGDKTVQTSCVQSFPTILNQLLDSELLRSLWPKSFLWGNAPLFGGRNRPEEVEAISGACVMMSRGVFDQVGLFCEDYFMYAEDIDLCYTIRQAGRKNYYIPDATVIHFGGGSTGKGSSGFSEIMMHESIWQFFRKIRGGKYGFSYRISTLIAAMGRLALLTIIFPLYIFRPDKISWNSSFRKWGAILAWSLGLGDMVRNHS